jgi:hypothetical protein
VECSCPTVTNASSSRTTRGEHAALDEVILFNKLPGPVIDRDIGPAALSRTPRALRTGQYSKGLKDNGDDIALTI